MSNTDRAATAQTATSDREIVITRRIDAPREMVFEAFTEVRHLSHWWGPEGFTATTQEFEFRPGGEWVFMMRGPDGTDYTEWISWTSIVAPARLTLRHGAFRGDPDTFESVLAFEPDDEATRLDMRTVFPTRESRDEAVERYHAVEAGGQTLEKLAAYVAKRVRQEAGQR
ncbi:SRPBCC family protein [Leifsonia sp. McL0607]|uniref:SRPBCC family protein n=1 Tax=Leifsonia sp. McL0607 TaxID=3415672 RepID=UPI003CF3A0C3